MPLAQPDIPYLERKFVIDLDRLPFGLSGLEKVGIEQGFLVYGEDGTETRVRCEDEKRYFFLLKKGEGEERETHLINLEEFQYQQFLQLCQSQISKIRYKLENICLDVFEQEEKVYCIAEVEFDSQQDSENFKIPEYFGVEVSDDERFLNRTLSEDGFPNDMPFATRQRYEKLLLK